MYFRTILSGTLAALLLSGAASLAAPGGAMEAPTSVQGPLGRGLPGVFDGEPAAGYQVAQAADSRVIQLEEQIRSLNGKLEELNFQILQMQEQMRKQQEDIEFRLQEMEKKSGMASDPNRNVAENPAAGDTKPADATGADGTAATAQTPPADTQAGADTTDTADSEIEPPANNGEPPRTFGTITVDKDGNVTSSSIDPPVDLLPENNGQQKPAGDVNVAALPQTDDPEELYRNSYQFILSGDYTTAEAGFRDHIKRFPSDAKASDANYWLGESLLGQQKYREAAEIFLAANKQYPKAKKSPDMLLKLGVSLAGLNQKDVACGTFAEVEKRYPDASGALKQRVKQEQALAAC